MKFSKKSIDNIEQADNRLQLVTYGAMDELNENPQNWKISDFGVLYSYRTVQLQFSFFKKGRELRNGIWVKVGRTVTDKDGYKKRSYHNYLPSYAIDVAPYPTDWQDIESFKELGRLFKYVANKLDIPIEWGAEIWKGLKDYPHFQIPRKNWND